MLRTFLKIIISLMLYLPVFPDFSYISFYPVLINVYFPLIISSFFFASVSVIKLIEMTSIKIEFLDFCMICALFTHLENYVEDSYCHFRILQNSGNSFLLHIVYRVKVLYAS